MKYLLTGHSGFLGNILKNEIREDILTLGRNNNSDILCDLSSTIPALPIVDTLIHNAGKAHSIPKTEAERLNFFQVNFDGTRNLLRGLEKNRQLPKSFIFISTVAVYGLDTGEMITESHNLNGKTPYARSKILAEELLTRWAQKNNITLGILRLPLIIGPNPRGNLKDMINGIRAGWYLGIGKSKAKKSAVWAKDIVTIIPRLAKVGGVYNLTDGYHPSFQELEESIARTLGKKSPHHIPISIAKGLALVGDFFESQSFITTAKLRKMTCSLTFDDSKAQKRLQWRPTPVLQKISTIV